MTDRDRRLEFHQILIGTLGHPNVYFVEPPNTGMQYPCIVYERDDDSVKHADNQFYVGHQRYQVTHIGNDPDSDVVGKLRRLPMSKFNRQFKTSGLNHDVFVIYH